MARTLTSYVTFFREAIVRQPQMGAIVPSQGYLVARMIAPVPSSYKGHIVELGAGTGALTVRLARRCPAARILACEISPALARELRSNLDAAGINGQVEVVSDAAESVLSSLSRSRHHKPDYIISGIPLGNVGKKKTLALISQIRKALPEGGMYIQFQHSLLDRGKIRASFSRVRTVPVLLNFPPAFVYYARK